MSNTDFITRDGWTIVENSFSGHMDIDGGGDFWKGGGESALTLHQGVPFGSGIIGVHSVPFAVVAGQYLQFYAFTASHRATNWVSLFFYNIDGNEIGYAGEYMAPRTGNGGRDLGGWDQVGSKSFKVPVGAATARMRLRKYDTFSGEGGSIAWFMRPYVSILREGQASWNAYSPGSAKAVLTQTNASIISVSTALTTKEAAITKRIDDSQSEYRDFNNKTNTRITEELSTISSVTGAFASKANALEAAVSRNGNSVVLNDNYNYCPDGQALPTHWITWVAQGNFRTNRLAPGRGGGQFCVQTLNDVAEVDSGFYQQVYTAGAGKWVVEVTVNGDASGLRGAGVTIHGVWNLDFLRDPDTNGYVGDSTGEVRSWSKMFDIDNRFDIMNVHAMHGWSGFGRGMAAKYMVWHRLSLRPATAGEILAGKADAALNNPGGIAAKVASHESAIVHLPANYASAGRANTLEAQMSRAVPSGLNSYIDGVNGRIDSVNSTTVTNLNSRIEERAQAWASQEAGAVATRANTIEAQMRREIPSPLNSYVDAVNGRIDSVNSTTVTNVNARIEDRASAWARQEAGAVASTVSTLRTEYDRTKGELSTVSSVASDAYGRSRAFLQQTAIANGNRAQISLYADSNGGAGVDIIGDVAFRGSLNVGPDSGGNRVKITNSGMTVFDGNGTMRVRLGLW